MSDCKFKKVAKNYPAFLCIIRPQEPDIVKNSMPESDPALKCLLDEYIDVFPDELPKALPPKRAMDHRIDLLPGSTPVSKPSYTMSLSDWTNFVVNLMIFYPEVSSVPALWPMVLLSCLSRRKKVICVCAWIIKL
jgi:hypothetical protein